VNRSSQHGEGTLNDWLRKPKTAEMGMQIPRDLHSEMAEEADLRSASERSVISSQRGCAT